MNIQPRLKIRSQIRTIEEANKMIPLLKSITEDVKNTWSKILKDRVALESNRDDDSLKEVLNTSIDKINGYIREIEELGCFMEEFKRGVVNFPSLYLGRKIFLCWNSEEDSIKYWHELDESYNERTRIIDVNDFLFSRPGDVHEIL